MHIVIVTLVCITVSCFLHLHAVTCSLSVIVLYTVSQKKLDP